LSRVGSSCSFSDWITAKKRTGVGRSRDSGYHFGPEEIGAFGVSNKLSRLGAAVLALAE
jgi:hypothetical protein